MARTREFERDTALDRATEIFARHGYEGSSTSDLLAHMGISRQSLYDTFGDKKRLFLEALERYAMASLAAVQAKLNAPGPIGKAIAAALLVDIVDGPPGFENGCVGVGSIAEFGRADAEVNAINDRAGEAFVVAFAERLRRGIAESELPATLDAPSAAHFLLASRSGLKLAARGGASAETLGEIAGFAVRGLH